MDCKNKSGIFSFFSGAGFLDLGFELSGKFDTVFVNEYHKAFMETYIYSREKMGIKLPEYGCHLNDISHFSNSEGVKCLKCNVKKAKENYNHIGFIGGPPCPDFSVAGKNRGRHGDNGKLSSTYIDLIIKVKPDFFLFENVKGLYRTAKHREFFEELKVKLQKSGYCLTEKLINSLEYGAPQTRERIILIGFKKKLLKKQKGNELINFNWNSHTLYDMTSINSFKWATQSEFSEDSIIKSELNEFSNLTVSHWFKKNDVENHPNSKNYFTPRAGLSKFEIIPEGDDSKKSYKRLHRLRYSPTAAYGNNEVHLHPYKARRLSVAEALAIQSLPKEFEIPQSITLTDMFKTIGNGVPYMAARGLALTIGEFIDSNLKK